MATAVPDPIASTTPYTGATNAAAGPVDGVSCIAAAASDADSRANTALGLDHPSPYPGACLALGWSGVKGDEKGNHVVFKEGVIVANVFGKPTDDTVALAAKYGVGPDLFGHILRLVAEA